MSTIGTQQNQGEPSPAVQPTPAEDKIIEGEVNKLLDEFKVLQREFEKEKDGIEENIKVPIVEETQPPALESQEIAVLTNGSKIILTNKGEEQVIENFNYKSSQEVIEEIKYKEENFSKFSNADGELGIKFETKLNEKMVKIDMEQIENLNQKPEKKDEYILEQINAAFKSGTASAVTSPDTAKVGGKKRKNKTKGNKSPIKKKHRTKRK